MGGLGYVIWEGRGRCRPYLDNGEFFMTPFRRVYENVFLMSTRLPSPPLTPRKIMFMNIKILLLLGKVKELSIFLSYCFYASIQKFLALPKAIKSSSSLWTSKMGPFNGFDIKRKPCNIFTSAKR